MLSKIIKLSVRILRTKAGVKKEAALGSSCSVNAKYYSAQAEFLTAKANQICFSLKQSEIT